MKFYLAPMEGLTGYIIRNAFHHHFDYFDKYYTPFIPAAKKFNYKIKNDLAVENNQGISLVPQAMSIVADEVMDLHRQLKAYGYEEININLGCPSGTVVSKKRGSGILADPDMLEAFLGELYDKADFPVSVKTRLGFDDDSLWPQIVDIYSRYPISELTIHTRVQKDFYKKPARPEQFALALDRIDTDKTPLCYNGDIWTVEDFKRISSMYPQVDRFMVGRGAFANPGLIGQIKGIELSDREYRQRLKAWHDEILEGYLEIFSGEKDAMFRMKEIWMYLYSGFEDGGRIWKKIKKAQTLADYKSVTDTVL